jgi:hypothetical protein
MRILCGTPICLITGKRQFAASLRLTGITVISPLSPFHFGVAELFNSIENSRAGTSNCCSRANNASSFAPSDATGIVSPFELMELLGAGASCLRCILCVHDMDWAVVGVSKTMRRASVLDLRV